MYTKVILCALALVAIGANAKVFFEDNFSPDADFNDRWTLSTHKGDEAGAFKQTAGKWFGDEKEDVGMKTTEDARFYQISAKLNEDFSNKGKPLVIQYSVKHEQNIDCGGGYVKLLPAGLDQGDFNGDSEYNIMFGPDICGSTKKVHVIFTYKGKNHLIKKEVPAMSDEKSHLYTLIVNPDNTYEVKIDGESKQTGSLKDDWDMLAPREINDPDESKPEDWDDRRQIPDPDDEKPSDWDDIPEQIADPDAEKPDDWDDELDGDWEAPMIDNPEYNGEWEPKMIDNPDYQASWEHPQIPNPDFVDDDELYAYDSHAFLGIEVWQVKAGTIFDRFLVTDDVAEAEAAADKFKELQEAETKHFDEIKEAERKQQEEERKKAEEEAAAKAEEEEDTLEEEDEEEEEDEKDEL